METEAVVVPGAVGFGRDHRIFPAGIKRISSKTIAVHVIFVFIRNLLLCYGMSMEKLDSQ